MAFTWFIYSPKTQKEMLEIQDELQRELEIWVEEQGDEGAEELSDTCGEVGPGGRIPSREEVIRSNGSFGRAIDPKALARLEKCRASIEIDRVRGGATEHPLQVAVLRFLLERTGESIIDWGEHTLETSEKAAARLAKARSRKLGSPTPVAKPVRVRKEKKGEVRSVRIVDALERCASDADLRIDLRRLADATTPLQRKYLELLRNSGAMDDAKAATLLKTDIAKVEAELDALEEKLLTLLGE
jgi:hypothetical protein